MGAGAGTVFGIDVTLPVLFPLLLLLVCDHLLVNRCR